MGGQGCPRSAPRSPRVRRWGVSPSTEGRAGPETPLAARPLDTPANTPPATRGERLETGRDAVQRTCDPGTGRPHRARGRGAHLGTWPSRPGCRCPRPAAGYAAEYRGAGGARRGNGSTAPRYGRRQTGPPCRAPAPRRPTRGERSGAGIERGTESARTGDGPATRARAGHMRARTPALRTPLTPSSATGCVAEYRGRAGARSATGWASGDGRRASPTAAPRARSRHCDRGLRGPR